MAGEDFNVLFGYTCKIQVWSKDQRYLSRLKILQVPKIFLLIILSKVVENFIFSRLRCINNNII